MGVGHMWSKFSYLTKQEVILCTVCFKDLLMKSSIYHSLYIFIANCPLNCMGLLKLLPLWTDLELWNKVKKITNVLCAPNKWKWTFSTEISFALFLLFSSPIQTAFQIQWSNGLSTPFHDVTTLIDTEAATQTIQLCWRLKLACRCKVGAFFTILRIFA